MNETTTNETDNADDRNARAVEDVIDTALDLGAVWVRYGLEVSRLALRTQSAWLGGMSKLLSHVADAIDPNATADARDATAGPSVVREVQSDPSA